MGTQSDTVTTSVKFASPATTCRNLYVAMTRGRQDNTVCVITDTHDIAAARDVLDTIIAVDRADVPATAQRRNLNTQHRRQPSPVRPVQRLQPRFEIPNWFELLRQATIDQLATAIDGYEHDQQHSAQIDADVADTEQGHLQARRTAAPFEDAITRTANAYTAARDCRDSLAEELAVAKRRDRPLLRSALAIADHDLTHAVTAKTEAKDGATPARRVVSETADTLRAARDNQRNHQLLEQLSLHPETIDYLTDRLEGLDTWQQWANGAAISPGRLEHAAQALSMDAGRSPQLRALCDTLPIQPAIARVEIGPELSID